MKTKQLYECLNHSNFQRQIPSDTRPNLTFTVDATLSLDFYGTYAYRWSCTCESFNFRSSGRTSHLNLLTCKHIEGVKSGKYGPPTQPCEYTQSTAHATDPSIALLSPEKVRRRPPAADPRYTTRYKSGGFYRITYYLCPVCHSYCRPIPNKFNASVSSSEKNNAWQYP